MTRKTLPRFILALAVLSLSLSCAGVQKNYPEKRYFVLNASRTAEPSADRGEAVLRIRGFRISPRYEGRGLVYRTARLTFESDFYNQFFISPAQMIAEETSRWLAEAKLFHHVLDAPSQALPDLVLEGAVTAVYGDYSRAGEPKAVMEIQFFLIQEASPPGRIVLQKNYRREIPLNGSSPQDLVQGWDQALEQILAALEKDLKEKL